MIFQLLSNHWLFLIGICFIFWLIFYIKRQFFREKNELPGPVGLPILGYIPFLGRYPYKTLTKLGQNYGPIFQIPLGFRTAVILNDYETITEAYSKDIAFAGRPNMPSIEAFANSGRSRFAFKSVKFRTFSFFFQLWEIW